VPVAVLPSCNLIDLGFRPTADVYRVGQINGTNAVSFVVLKHLY